MIQQKKEDVGSSKVKNKEKSLKNKDIMLITYVFIGLFVLLIGNLIYFIGFQSKNVVNNSYNKRQDVMAETVQRGSILAADGEILAESLEKSNGSLTRYYPYNNMFSHVVGRYAKGKTGLESSLGFTLLTSSINPITKAVNELKGEKSLGDNVVTTLDVDIQKVAYNALGNQKGAVVVMEPSTGKILAMVSKPDYNPNTITDNWESLTQDDDKNSALINRATQGLYPPGSTFKILTTLAYLREHNNNYEDFSYECDGSFEYGSHTINCHNNKVHGKINLEQAFAKSCNGAFASMGMNLNLNSFYDVCKSLLYNTGFNLDFNVKESSFTLNEQSNSNLIPSTSIGQGETLMTPIHNAMIVSAIANGGTLMTPYLVDHVEDASGDTVKKYMPTTYKTLMTSKEAEILTDFMEDVVTSGTATSLKGQSYKSAGKTGSAEIDASKTSHAWFVGYAAKEQPDVVVSIIVEGAGTGGDYAVPIAKKIFQAYYKNN